eukprot:CAMPEP_0181130402 /NCGR_PEP_ID=MMETSP1071-20121207/29843_1 /TAXON_ID=35127 /ORGANISM="Thalassiosira sp., Strain NH16" /LENGTH=313 /DNA_ID=CAMNT_0023216467 /DNA_START=96 /DNA_END=1037 /DNA_ORIENTATION=+
MGQICSICGSGEEAGKTTAFADATASSSDHPSSSHHSHLPPSLYAGQQQTSINHNEPPTLSSPLDNNFGHVHNNNNPSDPTSSSGHNEGQLDAMEENERQRRLAQYRLEQVELARREAIVNAASQSMVPVGISSSQPRGGMMGMMGGGGGHRGGGGGGGGGTNTYYDPAYAAAAAQDILRSAAITGGLVFRDDQATRDAWEASAFGVMPRLCAVGNPQEDIDGGGTRITQGGSSRSSAADNNNDAKNVMDALSKGRWDGVRLGTSRGGSGLAGCGGEDPEYYLDDLAESLLETLVPTKSSLVGGCASIVENLP